jgi:PKD repeat protein
VYTNGQDADAPPGPSIPVNDAVFWTYVVTNTGDVSLTNVMVTDSGGVQVYLPKTTLAPGEAMTCVASSNALVGQYMNTGTATGTPPNGPAVTASDPSHYFGVLDPPVASFDADPLSGAAPLTVNFADTSTGDDISSWNWTFGDGGFSSERNTSHTYTVPGSYSVDLTVANSGGSANATRTVTVTWAPAILQIPGGIGLPTDTDVDGLYDDVNGNGRKDFADVVLYFNQMTWIAANEPVSAFDYNGNGRIDFADVVWLFDHL